MNWNIIDVSPEVGFEDGYPCSICGDIVMTELFTPYIHDDEEAEWLKKIAKVDPFTEFGICFACLIRHGIDDPFTHANKWLKKEIEFFKLMEEE